MQKSVFSLLLLLTLSFQAGAQLRDNAMARSSGAGNGGDALICQNSPDYGDQVILLDTYEARKRRLTLNLNNSNIEIQTHRSMVNVAVARLMKKDVATAEKLYSYAMEMVNDLEKLEMFPDQRGDVLYIGKDVVGEINDSLHVTLPIGCEIRQLVSQKEPKLRFDYRYEINQSIWDQMSLFEQSMTILHEAWYRIMIESDSNSEHNSYAARYMNGLVASEEFEDFTFADYIMDLKETELKTYEVFNTSAALVGEKFAVDLKDERLSFEDENACVSDVEIPAQIKKFGIRGWFRGIRTLKVKFVKFCFKNSKVVSLELPKETTDEGFLLSMENYQISVKSANAENAVMIFHPNGKLDHITNVEIVFLLKMYYDCGGARTFVRRSGCSGPYRLHDSKINHPGQVFFSETDESPLDFIFDQTLESAAESESSREMAPQQKQRSLSMFQPQQQQQQQQQEQQQIQQKKNP